MALSWPYNNVRISVICRFGDFPQESLCAVINRSVIPLMSYPKFDQGRGRSKSIPGLDYCCCNKLHEIQKAIKLSTPGSPSPYFLDRAPVCGVGVIGPSQTGPRERGPAGVLVFGSLGVLSRKIENYVCPRNSEGRVLFFCRKQTNKTRPAPTQLLHTRAPLIPPSLSAIDNESVR